MNSYSLSTMSIHQLKTYNVDIQNVSFVSPHQEYSMSYPFTFGFEHDFDAAHQTTIMRTQWRWAYLISVIYVAVIYALQSWMKDRPRYELRKTLFVWNLSLAVFSIFGSFRATSEFLYVYENLGLFHTYCLCGLRFLDNRVGGFWNWMFTLSKVPELGDTVFIVLRKQPLIFLHWYHHVTVLLYAWYSYSDYIATARWFVCMNYLVHSVMYSYYALKAMKFKVPRWIAMTITTAQLAQMIMGSAVNIWAYQVKQAGNECHVSYDNIKVSLLMYISYFVLFARFFRKAYVASPKRVLGGSEKATNGYLANGKVEGKGKVE